MKCSVLPTYRQTCRCPRHEGVCGRGFVTPLILILCIRCMSVVGFKSQTRYSHLMGPEPLSTFSRIKSHLPIRELNRHSAILTPINTDKAKLHTVVGVILFISSDYFGPTDSRAALCSLCGRKWRLYSRVCTIDRCGSGVAGCLQLRSDGTDDSCHIVYRLHNHPILTRSAKQTVRTATQHIKRSMALERLTRPSE